MFAACTARVGRGKVLFDKQMYFYQFLLLMFSLCGLVVRVPGYRSRGPGLIPGATRFSEK
jgi:hypothetical protein